MEFLHGIRYPLRKHPIKLNEFYSVTEIPSRAVGPSSNFVTKAGQKVVLNRCLVEIPSVKEDDGPWIAERQIRIYRCQGFQELVCVR